MRVAVNRSNVGQQGTIEGHAKVRVQRHRRQRWVKLAFLAPLLIYLPLLFGYPLYYSVRVSLEQFTIANVVSGAGRFIGLGNLRAVLSNPALGQAAIHTLIFVVTSLVAQYAIGMGLALFLNGRVYFSGLIRGLLLIPWLLPSVVSVTVWGWMFSQTNGIIDSLLLRAHLVSAPPGWLTDPKLALVAVIIVNVWVGIPLNLVLLHSGLQGIPSDLYEVAQLDGASRLARFRYVTLPLLMPITRVLLLLGFIYTLKQFDIIYIMTGGGPGAATQLLSTFAYDLSFTNLNFGQGAMASNLIFIPALLLALYYVVWGTRRERGAS
jgi:multiple sugar transport system permease protein